MIPVYQHMTVANDGQGNCFNACVASILELPLRDVAQIFPRAEGDWDELWRLWFADRGLKLVYHDTEDGAPNGYSIASGIGARVYPEGHRSAGKPIHHACVAFNGIVVHDPFPLGGGFDGIYLYRTLEPLTEAETSLHGIRRAHAD